ncbi:TetR/AcrR family transcriptional regulator of autoinduction and epiphytic fitness [Microbacterium testaceum]|uniref:TetR/AcrR family transcriptional regulator n=1 Tax=Microbacterium testaceum TaxID=2033 RepID=UPI002784CBDA|nr:TetR/AcrR family transcriptional regulator [Microbacterium testaceum]MDQ1117610.1 TetR/AcrR family transcriptional regulator of autoinduction and epiphytic fitness [Microbacterium testaceum]
MVKAKRRRAILDTARWMISEAGIAGFDVDALAQRAGVSRRTVFNHFASIDDIVTTSCAEAWSSIIDRFREVMLAQPAGAGGPAHAFDNVATALRAADAPGIISYLWKALGGFDAIDPRPQQIFQGAFSRTTTELSRELAERDGTIDQLDAELIVASLMSGTSAVAYHWIAATNAATSAEARALWAELLERVIDNARRGYSPPASTMKLRVNFG